MLGALAIVGPALGTQPRIFLLSVAVVDDVVVVAVIGVVYSEALDPAALAVAAASLAVIVLLARVGVWRAWVYALLLLVLAFLIVRVVSFEWREKHDGARWRGTWMWANTIGSAGASLVWGVGLANLLHGESQAGCLPEFGSSSPPLCHLPELHRELVIQAPLGLLDGIRAQSQ